MCLFIMSGPHKAKKAFYTLKVAEGVNRVNCESFYLGHPQPYGETLESRIVLDGEEDGEKDVENGLHSLVVLNEMSTIFIGYFFDDTMDNILTFKRGVILCKVPKGATYYLGENGDIASDKLVLIEPILINTNCDFKLEQNLGHVENVTDALKLAATIVKEMGLNINPS